MDSSDEIGNLRWCVDGLLPDTTDSGDYGVFQLPERILISATKSEVGDLTNIENNRLPTRITYEICKNK